MRRGVLGVMSLGMVCLPSIVLGMSGGSLYLSTPSSTYAVGDTFSIQILADTGTSSVDAIEAELSFDPRIITIDHTSIGDSILSSWPTPPEYSNAKGDLQFSGWANTRYTGTGGKLLTITFRALAVGESPLTFISGAMLAPEGQDTNVIASMHSGAYVIIPKSEMAPVPVPISTTTVSSSTSGVDESAQQADTNRAAQSAAAANAATNSAWWSLTLLMIGCGVGMCIGYLLRARH